MRSLPELAIPLAATVLWTAALIVDPGPFSPGSVLLIGLSLLATSAVGVIGVLLVGGRWAHRMAVASIAGTFVIAIIRDVDVWWTAGVIVSSLATIVLFLPTTTRRIRKLPAAAGPPTRAVLVPVILLGAPFALGLAAWDTMSWATLSVGLTAPVAALWYARVFPGGLYVVRFAWPGIALALAPLQTLPVAILSVAFGLIVLVVAWHPSVKVAFHPPTESGTSYSIPPELAPQEILDAARIDDTGRRR